MERNSKKSSTNSAQKKKRKRTALVICHNRTQFWTTQTQFWQWIRDAKLIKLNDNPLTGKFVNANEESFVLLGNAVLNLAHKNHLKEVLLSRHLMKPR